MRRTVIAALAGLFLELAWPHPAQAWWGWIDELSGPGRSYGVTMEGRLWCGGSAHKPSASELMLRDAGLEARPALERVQAFHQSVVVFTAVRVPAGAAPESPFAVFAANTYQVLLNGAAALEKDLLTTVMEAVPASSSLLTTPKQLRDLDKSFETLASRMTGLVTKVDEALGAARQLCVTTGPEGRTSCSEQNARASTEIVNVLLDVQRDAREAALRLNAASMAFSKAADARGWDRAALSLFIPFAGVIYTACPTEKDIDRTVSINLGFRWLKSTDRSENPYAGGNQVRLATLVPAISWRPFHGSHLRNLDFFDVSTGAGVYWISSDSGGRVPSGQREGQRISSSAEIRAFSGTIIEPIRVDFHAPSSTAKTLTIGRALLETPTVRVGGVVFPRGFEPRAFGGDLTGDRARRRGGEWVWSVGFFADLGPIQAYLKSKGQPREVYMR